MMIMQFCFLFFIPMHVPDCALLARLRWTPLLCQMGSYFLA